jgi:hypothetical protein
MLSNVYNTEQLKQDIESAKTKITTNNESITNFQTQLEDVKGRIKKGQEYRDGLVSQKHNDIDNAIAILNPTKLNEDITQIEYSNKKLIDDLSKINVVEPSSFYHEDKHDKVKEEYNEQLVKKIETETKIANLNELAKSVSGGIKCEHCGIELLNAEITKTKLGELASYNEHYGQITNLMLELSGKEKGFVQLKKEFDEYEKNKLIKEKYEVNIESNNLKIDTAVDVGSNTGKWTYYLSKVSKNVISFEPTSLLFKLNKKLFSGTKKIKTYNFAFGYNTYNFNTDDNLPMHRESKGANIHGWESMGDTAGATLLPHTGVEPSSTQDNCIKS